MCISGLLLSFPTQITFQSNQADVGGAFSVDRLNSGLQDCTFEGNTAQLSGGEFSPNPPSLPGSSRTFFCDTMHVLRTAVCFFSNYLLPVHSLQMSFSSTTISSSSFQGSQAEQGGCVFASENAEVTFASCHFQGCQATESDGGALYVSISSTVDLNGGTISSSSAPGIGGGIFVSASFLSLNGLVTMFPIQHHHHTTLPLCVCPFYSISGVFFLSRISCLPLWRPSAESSPSTVISEVSCSSMESKSSIVLKFTSSIFRFGPRRYLQIRHHKVAPCMPCQPSP